MTNVIGDWTETQLRQFIVNNILTDPGSLPKPKPHDLTTDLPANHVDGDVPVWDTASQRWQPSTKHPIPSSQLANAPTQFIRIQGTGISGFTADLNFRFYNLSGSSVVMENDPGGHFHDGGGYINIDVPGNYMVGCYVVGRAAFAYEAAWTVVYNSATIDTVIQNGFNMGGVGVTQNAAISASGITNFFSSSGGTIQIGGFQNDATIAAAGLWAIWLGT